MNTRIAELEKFARAFLDNFKPCEDCSGTGWKKDWSDNCPKCHGTGTKIDSIGVLYVDLPEEARRLLGEE